MCCLLSKYHSDVIFGLWSMDIDWQVPSLCTDSSLRRHQQVQNHSNTRSSCAITLKIKPTTMSWSRCCFKKKSRKLCITNKYKYKIHNKIYPIQHSARSGKRCIEVTNRDEYKNITTRNVVFIFAVHHGHRGLYNDTTNQLPRSDFCVHRDFQRITIGVRDGRTDMA